MGQATHTHNWEIASKGPDGIIIQCSDSNCPSMAFLEGEEATKFEAAAACQTSVELELVDPLKK